MKPFRVSLTGRFLVLLALAALLSACQGEAPGTNLSDTQFAASGVAGASQNETATTTTPSTLDGTSAQTGAVAMNTGGSGTLTMGQTGGIPISVQATGGASSGGATQNVVDAGGTSNGGTSATPVTGACAADQTTCPSGCSNLQRDVYNCGICGTMCLTGETCAAGSCVCSPELTDCNGSCVDPLSNPMNCGGCGIQCGPSEVCSYGSCSADCQLGQTNCDQQCVDLTTSSAHCGGCGQDCAAGQTCQAGECTCGGELTFCNGQCVDTTASTEHCGTCNNACSGNQTCNGTDCACPDGQDLCGDTCQSIQDNDAHCGECFNACGEGLSCQGTTCECGADLSACGDSCIDVQSDPQNCGSCGTQCGSTQTCSGGNCAGGSCTSDNTTYNGRITYYDLATPLANCSFPTNLLPQYYAAMNEEDYANAAACGTCVQITNTQNNSQLVVQVVDQCPYQGNEEWCYAGSHHIDLNPPAYQALGASDNPPITWRYVSCNHGGNIQYLIEQNSSEYYLAVAIMNHENQIANVEVQVNGAFRSMTRPAHNEWELTTGAGNGPFTFRITDIHGNVVTDSNVPFTKGQPIDGSGQFPTCQ